MSDRAVHQQPVMPLERLSELLHATLHDVAGAADQIQRLAAWIAREDAQRKDVPGKAASGVAVPEEDSRVWIAYLAEAAADVEQSLEGLRRYSGAIDPPYTRARFPLNDALSLAMDRLRDHVSQAGGEITAEALPAVEADYTRAVLIFHELLDNAIKFCPGTPPAIRISAKTEDARVRVSVTDNGMGMEAKQHERIFRPFARLWGKRFPGAGMGLAIARAAVEMHGGRIWAKANQGEGSTFQFTLPAAA